MSDDPRLGTVLDGRYKIIEQVASGGMGLVYRAERIELGRTVAIKFLHEWSAAKPEARKRFEVEARAMARLDHPNCAAVIDVGVDGHVPYVVMDFVAGETLRDMLDQDRLRSAYAVDIMRQVLSGLAHAHEQGIIHRDIKPGNVMVGEATGVGVQVKILDFGLARLADSGAVRLTAVGSTIGTPAYMAPEQCIAGATDARTDVYACGVLLFEMLTGQKPFRADDPIAILEMQRQMPPPRLGSTVAEDFGDLEVIVARALAKEPELRYQSASEMAAALEQARFGGSAARASRPRGPRAAARRAGTFLGLGRLADRSVRPWVIGVSAGLVLIVLIVALAGGEEAAPAHDAGSAQEDAAVQEAFQVDDDLEASVPDLPGVAEAKELMAAGRIEDAVRRLVELRDEHPDSAESNYLLGRLYFHKLWWKNGVDAYRRAIELDERYRTYPPLIKSALRGFIVTPELHDDIADFLHEDIGEAALPYLRETAADHPREKVRERAAAQLERY